MNKVNLPTIVNIQETEKNFQDTKKQLISIQEKGNEVNESIQLSNIQQTSLGMQNDEVKSRLEKTKNEIKTIKKTEK
jgi:peptidoglycan hydrolase CwlO-like protein